MNYYSGSFHQNSYDRIWFLEKTYDTIMFHKNSYENTCVSETLDFSYEILQLKYYEKS